MARLPRSIKTLLLVLAALLVCALAIVAWLRYEFARVERDAGQPMGWMNVTIADREALPEPDPCGQRFDHPQAWFGALHVHTGASYDATAFGSAVDADSAYAFARGQALPLRLRGDPPDYPPAKLVISSPLDFMAVTDHAETLGENDLCYDRGERAYGALVCRLFRGDLRLPMEERMQPLIKIATQAIFGQDRSRRVCGADGSRCRERAIAVWRENQRSTEAWQDRGSDCSFTTFHGYEYTLAVEASNLHRNVIFRNAAVPAEPLSAKDADTPEQLWQWLRMTCIDGHPRCDAMAIPHNSNWSSGRMWFPYSKLDLPSGRQIELAALRSQLEPLAEIMQVKGDSECRNGITSVLGAADEFCDFEKLRPPSEDVADCGETMGAGGMVLQGCTSRYSFVRYALTAGLGERNAYGINPFRLGIIAATDTHIGAPAAGLERGHQGSHGIDREPRERLSGNVEVPGGIGSGSPARFNPGGIAGVYARENSRDALFTAMRRRETFGTSGPRIRPRFFAGWNLPQDLCQSPRFLEQAYEKAVPMGSNIPPAPAGGSPVFIASATADPRTGANLLQRMQVIKGWIDDDGNTRQAIYDIAGNRSGEARVDRDTCAVSGPGFTRLCASWSDPDFEPSLDAVYYLRILENPSCRWSHYDCLGLPAKNKPAACSDPDLPWQIQERAWTSPIWYQPEPTSPH